MSVLNRIAQRQASSLVLHNASVVGDGGVERKDLTFDIENLASPLELDGEDIWVYPPLWNSHEHLDFNCFPRIGNPPHPNAYEWGLEITQRKRDPRIDTVLSIPAKARYRWGILKNILSATAFVIHHGDMPGFLRRSDMGISLLPNHGSPHSLRFEKHLARKFSSRYGFRSIHLAEGTDAEAAAECKRLDEMGFLQGTGIIHGVGLSNGDLALLKKQSAVFIWCPSSNDFLFRSHAPIRAIIDAGIPVLLGTDSTLTGTRGIIDEAAFAHTVFEDSRAIFRMIASTPARLFHRSFPDRDAGFLALRKRSENPHEDFLRSQRRDVLLFVHRNSILLADADLAYTPSGVWTRFRIDGREKSVFGDWAGIYKAVMAKVSGLIDQGIELA